MSGACLHCGTTDDTRPYGPGGEPICFPCMKADPEREAAAGSVLGLLLDANAAISPIGVVALGGSDGPIPFELPAADRGSATPDA